MKSYRFHYGASRPGYNLSGDFSTISRILTSSKDEGRIHLHQYCLLIHKPVRNEWAKKMFAISTQHELAFFEGFFPDFA